MKKKYKVRLLLGLFLVILGFKFKILFFLGALFIIFALKKRRNVHYINNLFLLLFLQLLQYFVKQDTFILFDSSNKDTQLLDNYTLFERMQKRGIKSYYLCHEKHPQYKEIKNIYKDKVLSYVQANSLLYKLFFKLLRTKAILESFSCLSNSVFGIIKNSKKIELIFSQHGITFFKDKFVSKKSYSRKKYDKIIISNEFEKKIFKERGKFKDEDFLEAGLARWDLLKSPPKRKAIMIYFTHRNSFASNKLYKESLYYKNLKKLLQSGSLRNLLNSYNIKLYVALHHSIREHLKKFEIENVKLVEEFAIDKIKNKTNLLITDYSSMCFEYFYKNKPVIFYRLDKNDPFLGRKDEEYQKSLKAKDKYIFNVFYTKKKVLSCLEKYIKGNFKLEEKNMKKVQKFFYYRDNISDRIIDKLVL